MSYIEYRDKIEVLRQEGKTTGANHSEAMLGYTDLNRSRMKRLDKTARLLPEMEKTLEALETPMTMLVLTEAWCGDAAQVIPVLNKMASFSPLLSLKLILRDEHPEVMDAFLTNGARSIPKVIFMTGEEGKVSGTWGPRPAAVQEMAMATKVAVNAAAQPEEKRQLRQEGAINAQKWYARDKTRTIQHEIARLVNQYQQVPAH